MFFIMGKKEVFVLNIIQFFYLYAAIPSFVKTIGNYDAYTPTQISPAYRIGQCLF